MRCRNRDDISVKSGRLPGCVGKELVKMSLKKHVIADSPATFEDAKNKVKLNENENIWHCCFENCDDDLKLNYLNFLAEK